MLRPADVIVSAIRLTEVRLPRLEKTNWVTDHNSAVLATFWAVATSLSSTVLRMPSRYWRLSSAEVSPTAKGNPPVRT